MKFKGMEKVGDLLLINLLFVVCSLPVVTIGASATAMYYVLGRIRRQEGTVTKDFFRSFRENFRQASLYWGVLLLVALALYWNFRLISGWTGTLYSDDGIADSGQLVCGELGQFGVSAAVPV